MGGSRDRVRDRRRSSPGRWRGLEDIATGWRDFLRAWEGFHVEPYEYRALDRQRVLVLSHWRGRGKMSGLDLARMGGKGAGLFHVRDGKVTRFVLYFDRSRALSDLGLAPENGERE